MLLNSLLKIVMARRQRDDNAGPENGQAPWPS
jgi:hypothetical protein